MDTYTEAFQQALSEVRRISGLSDIEKSESYEPLKAKIYELLRAGETDSFKVGTEALSWLRQRAQIAQSASRVAKEVAKE